MTREQLSKLFPDGRTVHLPTDGNPLPGYQLALADLERGHRTAPAPTKKRSLLAGLFGVPQDAEETDDTASARQSTTARRAAEAKPARVAAAEAKPAPAVEAKLVRVASAEAKPALEAKPPSRSLKPSPRPRPSSPSPSWPKPSPHPTARQCRCRGRVRSIRSPRPRAGRCCRHRRGGLPVRSISPRCRPTT